MAMMPAAVACVILATAACEPRYRMLTEKHYPPRPRDYPIELYATDVQTPHERIAILDSREVDRLTTATRKMLIEDLRMRARKFGADAVTNVVLLTKSVRGWVPDPQTPFRSWRQGWRDHYFLRGYAIRFKPLMIETGESGPAGARFDFAEGEKPAATGRAESELEIYETTDRFGRKGYASRRARPVKPRLPAIELGD